LDSSLSSSLLRRTTIAIIHFLGFIPVEHPQPDFLVLGAFLPPLPPSATYTESPRAERYLAHDQNGRSGPEPLFAPSKLMLS
jgi:hypothetical protein